MVIAQLKELLGKTKSIIIVNGKLLTVNGFPVFGRKPNKTVKFFYTDNHQAEHEVPNAVELIEHMLMEFDEKYGVLYKDLDSVGVTVGTGCVYTHAVSLSSQIYTLLQDECMRTNIQYADDVDSILLDFLYHEVVNSYEVFERVLKIYLIKNRFPTVVKGHLAGRFYQPYIFDTKAIHSAFNYGRFSWFKSMIAKDGLKLIDVHSSSGPRANMFVVPTDSYCDLLRMKIIPDVDSRFFIFALHACMINQICVEMYNHDGDANLFSTRVGEFSKLNSRTVNAIYSEQRTKEWYDSFTAGFNNLMRGVIDYE